jgi:hypothetical protein
MLAKIPSIEVLALATPTGQQMRFYSLFIVTAQMKPRKVPIMKVS